MAVAEQEVYLLNEYKNDVTCPICYECLTEPVVFPCRHEMYQSCFPPKHEHCKFLLPNLLA